MYSFFFFKQKTAYEMRISDWSSDVCSSDLELIFKAEAVEEIAQHGVVVMGKALELAERVGHLRQRLAEMLGHHLLIGHIVRHLPQPVHIVGKGDEAGGSFGQYLLGAAYPVGADRKRVGWGTSVSVGVDIGGRR